jgi:hypothetical protein
MIDPPKMKPSERLQEMLDEEVRKTGVPIERWSDAALIHTKLALMARYLDESTTTNEQR